MSKTLRIERILKKCVLFIFLCIATSCSAYKTIEPPYHPLQQNREQARQAMLPLDVNVPSPLTGYMEQYLEYYNLNFDNIEYQHTFGTFVYKENTLVAHIFKPQFSRGTVFAIHGYLDHIGVLRNLIQHCLEHDYTVVTFDLPGHGLSSGKPVSIDSFSDYASILDVFINLCSPMVTHPFYLVGHCVGSAISLEYLSTSKSSQFEKIVFLAPFVRSPYWYPVKYGFYLGTLTQFKNIDRSNSKTSSDEEFLKFYRNDPLQFDRIPIEWIKAMYKWENKIQTMHNVSANMLIIQGTSDGVVDSKYNIPFLRKHVSEVKVEWIKGGRHQLLNESEPIRNLVLNIISEFLNSNENRN